MKIIENIQPEINTDRISRLLGYGKKRKLSKRMTRNIEKCIEKSSNYINPRIVFTEKNIKSAEDGKLLLDKSITLKSKKMTKALKKCNRATVFLATIGENIDSIMHELILKKKVTQAYIYDTIGSVAAENIVDKFQKELDIVTRRRGEMTTLRFSPGYCDWNVQEQRKLFQMLDNSLIDVHLSKSCMMTPRKTVSGIFGIGKIDEITKTETNPCMLCGMKNCIARRTGTWSQVR